MNSHLPKYWVPLQDFFHMQFGVWKQKHSTWKKIIDQVQVLFTYCLIWPSTIHLSRFNVAIVSRFFSISMHIGLLHTSSLTKNAKDVAFSSADSDRKGSVSNFTAICKKSKMKPELGSIPKNTRRPRVTTVVTYTDLGLQTCWFNKPLLCFVFLF